VSCAFSMELLALHVENDLSVRDAQIVEKHLLACGECRRFLEQLGNRQSQLKLLRRDTIHPSAFVKMRLDVLELIKNAPSNMGWPVRIERMLFLGFRRQAVVFTCLAIAAVVSATLFAQMRQMALPSEAGVAKPVAVFAGSNVLVRPVGYRDWISVGSSIEHGEEDGHHIPGNGSSGMSRSVYIDRLAYREFSNSGKFPEGAVLILETSSTADKHPIALEASVKGNRFEGGWGFFNFTNGDGTIKDSTQSIFDKDSCRSCHEKHAKFDHVFTQFHSALKTAT
jgi:hypothetical protein